MKIHVQLVGIKLGPYSEKQVRDYLADGLLSLSDPARLDGADEWKPVEEILAQLPVDNDAVSPMAGTITPDAAPAEEQKAVALDEPKMTSATISTPVTVSKNEPTPLSMPLVVKSLVKKNNPMSKTSHGLVSLAPSTKAAENPITAFSPPLKVLTKKPEPETKPKIKPILTISAPAKIESVNGEANSRIPTSLLPVPILVIGKKPESGAKITPAVPMEPSPAARPVAPEKPVEKIAPTSPEKSISSSPVIITEPVAKVVAKPEETTISIPKAASAEKPLEEKPVVEKISVTPPPRAKRRYLRWMLYVVGLVIVLGLLLFFYIESAYRAADALRSAMNSGDQTQLESTIDFPGVRDSLKQQLHGQLAKVAAGTSGTAAPAVTAMIDHSIDYYVTPAGLSGLLGHPGSVPPGSQARVIVPDVAARILNDFNRQAVQTERFAGDNDLVVDLETVRLHLRFYGTAWKLNRVELLTDLPLPTPPVTVSKSVPPVPAPTPVSVTPASVPEVPPIPVTPPASPVASPTTDTSSSLTRPVIATYLDDSQAKYQKGDWDGAIAAASQALAIDAKNTVAYFNRASARQAKGDMEGALADFSQVIELDPKLAEAYFERGKILALKKDYAGALADFTQSLTLDPNQAPVYSNRGYVREAQNDLPGAMADYTQALTLNPKIAGAYFNRGRVRQTQGDFDGAISDFNQALNLDPKMIRIYYNRGNAKSAKRDWDGAIADFNQALTLDPTNAMAYCQRGVAREARNDLPGATADFTQALTIDSKIGSAYYYRGLLRERNDDLDGAITDNTRAIELDPNNAQAYYNRGFARLSKGILDGAADDLQKFCQLAPHDAYADHARLYLWMIARAQNRKDDADRALSDALQNNWNSLSGDFITQLANFLLGRITEAEVIAAAISPDPNKDQGQHCEVWYFAGMQRLLSGDRDKALDYFQRCLDTNQKEFCEYILAKSELQVLQPAGKPQVSGP